MIVEHCVEIDAPAEYVYNVSQDYSVRYLWDPFPKKMEMLHGEHETRQGAEVRVVAHSGLVMEVRFVQCKPPEVAAIVMTKGPFFLAILQAAGRFEIQDILPLQPDSDIR